MPTLVVRHPDGTETEHELGSSLTIGRAEGNDLVLSQGGVSRKHATVSNEGGAVFVEDHGSANGTFVDGEKIGGKTKLGPRAQIVIGDYELSMKAGAPAAKKPGASGQKPAAPRERGPGAPEQTTAQPSVKAPPRATKVVPSVKPGGSANLAKRPAGAAAAPPAARAAAGGSTGAHLKGITGPWANKVYPVRGKIIVGRVAGVQVVIEDDSVSRRHAEIEKTAAGVVLRDLGSANGTMLNGNPVTPNEEFALNTGDVVQFGVIEMIFDAGDAEVMNAPTRRGGGARAGGAAGGAGGGGGIAAILADPKKKKIVFGAAGGVLLLLVGVAVIGGGKGDDSGGGDVVDNGGGAMLPPDPAAQLEEWVAECRTYSATDLAGQEPDWPRAEKACQRVLDEEPIHVEATVLMRKIKTEKEAYEFYKAAEKLMRVQREEEALDQYAKIPEESAYFRKVRAKVKETVDSVKKRTGEDCKSQVRSRFYSSAVSRCEKYMQLACCEMPAEELSPPPGYKIVLDGKLPKDGWRPKDPVHIAYLRAKKESMPDAPPFECPNTRIFCAVEVKTASAADEVEKYVKGRYTEKGIQNAMMAYWRGSEQEAIVSLLKLREDRTKASVHPMADSLRADMSSVAQLYKRGQGMLQQEKKAMDADEPFREALEIDARLMQEMTEKRPSFYRRNINADMAAAAYHAGKDWANKKDQKKACTYWKTGFAYSKVDPDLLRAIGNCSVWAAEYVKGAQTCEDLDYALTLAVDGDGIKAKIDNARAEMKCPTN